VYSRHVEVDDASEVRTASIITLMTEAVSTSETSVNFNVATRRYIPKDSKLRDVSSFTADNHMRTYFETDETVVTIR
jgi:hypothetical protein